MQSLTVALRKYSRMDPNWASHPPAQSIWTVVHEELRNKCQGWNSTMPIPQPQSQGPIAAPGMIMRQQGMQMTMPGGPRIIGGPQNNMQRFICGGPGHWARNCPQAAVTGTLHRPHVRAKISQVGDQTILTSNKGWSFDLNEPPPSNCRRCGGMHWEMFPCGQQGTVSLLPQTDQQPAQNVQMRESSSSQEDLLVKAVGALLQGGGGMANQQ